MAHDGSDDFDGSDDKEWDQLVSGFEEAFAAAAAAYAAENPAPSDGSQYDQKFGAVRDLTEGHPLCSGRDPQRQSDGAAMAILKDVVAPFSDASFGSQLDSRNW